MTQAAEHHATRGVAARVRRPAAVSFAAALDARRPMSCAAALDARRDRRSPIQS